VGSDFEQREKVIDQFEYANKKVKSLEEINSKLFADGGNVGSDNLINYAKSKLPSLFFSMFTTFVLLYGVTYIMN